MDNNEAAKKAQRTSVQQGTASHQVDNTGSNNGASTCTKQPRKWAFGPDAKKLAPQESKDPRVIPHHTLFFDKVWSDADWSAYMSAGRFIPNFSIFLAVFITLLTPLLLVFFIAVSCGIYQGLKPDSYPSLDDLDLTFAYSTVGFALSLLLVFKTNTSYARFWEARTAWGAVYTYCRTFLVRMEAYAHTSDLPTRQFLLRWTIALPYLMRSHLTDYKPGSDSIEALLLPCEARTRPHPKAPSELNVTYLREQRTEGATRHQPLLATNALMQAVQRLRLSGAQQMDVAQVLQSFMSSCGICERIARTPIPFPYSRHTTRFLMIYVAFLPFALWDHLGYATIAVAPVLTLLLCGIENIGVQIEQPMKIMPMAAYCETIHADLLCVAGAWAHGGYACRDSSEQLVSAQGSMKDPSTHVHGPLKLRGLFQRATEQLTQR